MIYNEGFNYKTTNTNNGGCGLDKKQTLDQKNYNKTTTTTTTTTNEEARRDAKQTSKCASMLQA